MSKQFNENCDYTQRMFEVLLDPQKAGMPISQRYMVAFVTIKNIDDFCEVANLMHTHLKESHIFGVACPDEAWKNFVQAIEKKYRLPVKKAALLASAVFYSIDEIAPYT